MTTENTAPETNGTPAVKTPSPLIAIRAEFDKAGGKVGKPAKEAKDAFLKAHRALADHQAATEELQAKVYAAARALMVATGAQPLKIDGVVYNPTARGEVVFYRTAQSKDIVSL